MDSQDLRNLQEAYSNVYEQQIGVPLKDASDRAAKDQLKKMIPKGEKVYTPKATLQNAAYEPEGDEIEESGLLGTLDKAARNTAGTVGGVIGREKASKTPGANLPIIGGMIKNEGERRGRQTGKQMYDKAKETVGGLLKQDYEPDAFDVILEYLVAEGYADTNDNALVIMANMSEEWRQTILEYGGGGGAAPNIPNAAVKAVDKLGSMFNKVAPKKPVKKQTPDGFNPHQKFN